MRKKQYIICGLILMCVIVFILSLRSCQDNNLYSGKDDLIPAEKDITLDFEPAVDKNNSIKLPATTGLYMRAEQIEQTVDFYNPDSNPCYFKIFLYLSNDTLIYESDLLEPSEHVIKIDLLEKLEKGTYKNCRMVYQCYSLNDNSKLNNGEVVLEIKAQ